MRDFFNKTNKTLSKCLNFRLVPKNWSPFQPGADGAKTEGSGEEEQDQGEAVGGRAQAQAEVRAGHPLDRYLLKSELYVTCWSILAHLLV
jgi:hypothetical protein